MGKRVRHMIAVDGTQTRTKCNLTLRFPDNTGWLPEILRPWYRSRVTKDPSKVSCRNCLAIMRKEADDE